MSNVILAAIVVLLFASCSHPQNKKATVKVCVPDSLLQKDSNAQQVLLKETSENCSDKTTPPVWYIWDSKRFFW